MANAPERMATAPERTATAPERSVSTSYWSVVEDIVGAGPTIIALFDDEPSARAHALSLTRQGRKADIEPYDFAGCGCGGS